MNSKHAKVVSHLKSDRYTVLIFMFMIRAKKLSFAGKMRGMLGKVVVLRKVPTLIVVHSQFTERTENKNAEKRGLNDCNHKGACFRASSFLI